MRTLLRSATAALLLLDASAFAADRSVTLKIDGWHSKGDAFKTESAVRAVKGVRATASDAAAKTLTVQFDDAVASRAQIEKAVLDAGYAVAR